MNNKESVAHPKLHTEWRGYLNFETNIYKSENEKQKVKKSK